MSRPVVIVDPLSSGIELAPAFKARGVPAIAVTLPNEEFLEFGSKIRQADFIDVISESPNLESILRKVNPLAILPGTEEGIPLAESLTETLLPHLSNDAGKSFSRSHKGLMQRVLADAGMPFLKTLTTACEDEAADWIKENGMGGQPFILKPPSLSGSEMVFHIAAQGNWKKYFHQILTEPSVVTGKVCDSVVIQEEALGTEFAVGTVSAHGRHYLAHLMKYHKQLVNGRRTVFDYVEFVDGNDGHFTEVFRYTQNALDALGIKWGAAHTEIMLTANGPRLIESSPRMIGGPVVGFARAATGSSQADKLAEIYVDGDVANQTFTFKKTVVPVFLRADRTGIMTNTEVMDQASQLPTFLSNHMWVENGTRVSQTVDYLTSIGIIALAGERGAIFSDYNKVRSLEARLNIESGEGYPPSQP